MCYVGWFLDWFRLEANGYYYTYSALAQSLAALLGVGGVFAIYRLQLQQTLLLNMEEQLRSRYATQEGEVLSSTLRTREELIQASRGRAKELSSERSLASWVGEIKRIADAVELAERHKRLIKEKALQVGTALAVSVFVSLLLVAQSERFEHSLIGAGIILVVFVATALILVQTIRFAAFCLEDD